MQQPGLGQPIGFCLIVKLIFEKNNFVMTQSTNHLQKVQWECSGMPNLLSDLGTGRSQRMMLQWKRNNNIRCTNKILW